MFVLIKEVLSNNVIEDIYRYISLKYVGRMIYEMYSEIRERYATDIPRLIYRVETNNESEISCCLLKCTHQGIKHISYIYFTSSYLQIWSTYSYRVCSMHFNRQIGYYDDWNIDIPDYIKESFMKQFLDKYRTH
jgi:hypothetical protein